MFYKIDLYFALHLYQDYIVELLSMTNISQIISPQQARKLVLLSQRLPPRKVAGNAIDATLSAIEYLGYIQIDTISAIQRAHHHTLWNRNPRYDNTHLDELVTDRKVFEYWSHAAAYLPMKDYRYSLPRKHAIAIGKEKHWFLRDEKLMKSIIKRIDNEGPLMAKDFESEGKTSKDWESKPVKQALGNLFMQGDIMIRGRQSFHKIYDLPERVLPDNIDISMPTEEEHYRFLILQFLRANGLGNASEICYLLKNIKSKVSNTLKEMHVAGELIEIKVNEISYYALPSVLELLNKPLSKREAKILSPFDNLIIQRKRITSLFGFDYFLECYVPAAKRKFGYFVLPILWNGMLVARMDCKADRKTSVLHINSFVLESHLKKTSEFALAIGKEINNFIKFNHCHNINIHSTFPKDFGLILKKTLDIS